MKRLINELFTKEEIMSREHEKTRKNKKRVMHRIHLFIVCLTVLEAIKVYYFQNYDIQVAGFWDYEGKTIRGNQRRGIIFRNMLL